jgi:hypothetical protein
MRWRDDPLTHVSLKDTIESMNDSTESSAQGRSPWLLLIHQVPPKPDYLRVKVRRRLQQIGALAMKSTVYVLPNTAEALEDLHWVRSEIVGMGGTALICETAFVAGISDEEVDEMLRAEKGTRHAEGDAGPERIEPGRTWVTRRGVFIDRIASAWLIRRFIDSDARFRFVPDRGHRHREGELRFDMYEAEYTHEGERCTFQTLVRRFGLRDPALAAIGDIVRDIDCKAERYRRPETAGVASVIRGIADLHADDEQRIARGAAVFDELYAAFQGTAT